MTRLTLLTASIALCGGLISTTSHAAPLRASEISPTLPQIAAQIARDAAFLQFAKRGRSGTGQEDNDRDGKEANDVCDPADDNDDDCVMPGGQQTQQLAKRGRSGTGQEDQDRDDNESNDICDPNDDNDDDCA